MFRFSKLSSSLLLCFIFPGINTVVAHGQQSIVEPDPGRYSGAVERSAKPTLRDDWPSYNGDYTGRRYSSLTQVTPENAHELRAQWVFHSRNAGILEVTPVVIAGVMFVTGSNDAYALDAVTRKNALAAYPSCLAGPY